MSAHPVSTDKPEFSITLAVTDVPPNGTTVPFEANESERAALARQFGLIELRLLKGKVSVKPWRRHGLVVDGNFQAELVQACVMTLEPIGARLSRQFIAHYLPEEMIKPSVPPASDAEIFVDLQAEDPPEPIENGRIDIGEAVAEELAVAIDPYPKKPGTVFEPVLDDVEADEDKPANPFAALEKFKKKD